MMIVINVSSCERVRLVQFLNRNRSQQICVGCGWERRKYCQNEGPMIQWSQHSLCTNELCTLLLYESLSFFTF